MARHRSARVVVPLALTLVLILSPTSLAQQWGSFNPPFLPAGQSSQSQTRLKRDTQCRIDCQIDQLSANEPNIRIQAEAGVNEIWDPREQKEFQCAGVTVVRTQVEPNGLFLPHYNNAPSISYVIRGKALLGVTNPGCPETYEYGSSEPFSSERDIRRPGQKFERPGREFESIRDQHQKIRRVYQGHIVALPAGVSKWFYNDGQDRLTIVTLFDTLNNQNQLDDILRSFFLAGNPQGREGAQGGKGSQGIFSENNILSGFDRQLLSQAFGIEPETVSKIQGQNDDRGAIIRVEGDLGLLIPEWDREESRRPSESYRPGQGSEWDPRYPGHGSQRPFDPRYPGHGSQRPAHGSEWDPRYPGHESQRPAHGSERDPRYPGHESQRPAHGSERDPRYPGHESQRPAHGSERDPRYPGHGSQRPTHGSERDPRYPGHGSQRPTHGSEWDPRYPGHESQRPTHGSEWDPRYPGHGSQRPTHGSERDPRYPGHGSQRPAHGSEWDPRYPGHGSQRPAHGSQWEPSYPGHGSERPGHQGQERICGGRRCICEENGVCKPNGIEETLCSVRITENIDNPEKADVFNPQGGRLTSLNSQKLPILNYLQLSAEKVNLYQNAIMAPNWKINAHSIIYFTKGNGRVQIAGHEGRLVFDDMVQEGQLLVVPQNFVVLKKAGQEGLEWVAFLTSDEAMISPLAGRISAIRGLPEQVVMNSYGLSREEAKRLKYGRQELTVFSPSEEFQRKGKYAIM